MTAVDQRRHFRHARRYRLLPTSLRDADPSIGFFVAATTATTPPPPHTARIDDEQQQQRPDERDGRSVRFVVRAASRTFASVRISRCPASPPFDAAGIGQSQPAHDQHTLVVIVVGRRRCRRIAFPVGAEAVGSLRRWRRRPARVRQRLSAQSVVGQRFPALPDRPDQSEFGGWILFFAAVRRKWPSRRQFARNRIDRSPCTERPASEAQDSQLGIIGRFSPFQQQQQQLEQQ